MPLAPFTCPSGDRVAGTVVADAAGLATERLEAEITSLAGHIAAATCRLLLLIAEFDRREAWGAWDCRSAAHWLMWQCGMSLRTAQDHVRVAHALEYLPQVRAHFAAGVLSYSKVRAITRVAEPYSEDFFLNFALNGTTSHLERAVAGYRKTGRLDDQAANDRHRGRYFRWWLDDDGMVVFEGRFAPEDAAWVIAAVEAATVAPAKRSAERPDDAEAVPQPGPDGKATLVDKAAQTIPPRVRRQVEARDHGCCRIPGCGATGHTHLHHIIHRAHRGPNEVWNLVTLCGFHHRLVHEGGYRVELDGDRVILHRPGRPPLVDLEARMPAGPGITITNLDLGLDVEPTTIICNWDGTRLTYDDLSWAIAFLNHGLAHQPSA